MNRALIFLIVEALAVYSIVLGAHALRRRFGMAFFYALMGGVTAAMSWVTDMGLRVEAGGLTFNVGSTVLYTALMLGVFVLYVFDGPRAVQTVIAGIVGVSILMPLVAAVLHLQASMLAVESLQRIPVPDLRINAASVVTTLVDMLFLGVAWESLGKPALHMKLWLRTFVTLLGVMALDVVLFSTLAFLGTASYWDILQGTLLSRLLVSIAAFPILYLYISRQSRRHGVLLEERPVLAILRQLAGVSEELNSAQQEIARRRMAEASLQQALAEVKTLKGFLPICARCKRIRDDDGFWQQIEAYVREHSDAEFSHGICPECYSALYPNLKPDADGPSE